MASKKKQKLVKDINQILTGKDLKDRKKLVDELVKVIDQRMERVKKTIKSIKKVLK